MKGGNGLDIDNVMFVDPGFDGTGWAYWQRLSDKELLPPTHCGVVRPKAKEQADDMNLAERSFLICERFAGEALALCAPFTVYLELPEVYGASAKSHASAVKGDLIKLTFLTGALALSIVEDEVCDIKLLKPSEWKGQLNKEAVQMRIKRALGNLENFPNHTADAVGMGLSVIGVL